MQLFINLQDLYLKTLQSPPTPCENLKCGTLFSTLAIGEHLNFSVSCSQYLERVVSTATRCGLDSQGLENPWGSDFPDSCRPVPRPTQSPVQFAPALPPSLSLSLSLSLWGKALCSKTPVKKIRSRGSPTKENTTFTTQRKFEIRKNYLN
jgi:hypothetical protein